MYLPALFFFFIPSKQTLSVTTYYTYVLKLKHNVNKYKYFCVTFLTFEFYNTQDRHEIQTTRGFYGT